MIIGYIIELFPYSDLKMRRISFDATTDEIVFDGPYNIFKQVDDLCYLLVLLLLKKAMLWSV